MDETRIPGENRCPTAIKWQTLTRGHFTTGWKRTHKLWRWYMQVL